MTLNSGAVRNGKAKREESEKVRTTENKKSLPFFLIFFLISNSRMSVIYHSLVAARKAKEAKTAQAALEGDLEGMSVSSSEFEGMVNT
jgi:hypothetical protein